MMAAPALSAAQSPLPLNQTNPQNPSVSDAQLGGIPGNDTVKLTYGGTGAPLRFGKILKGSEWVSLNGVRLRAGTDYSIDYAVGVVYLNVPFKEGDSLTVQYRHDPKMQIQSGSAVSGMPAMKFNLGGSALGLSFGAGGTERTADGKVYRTNVAGTKNNFSGKGASLTGAYFGGTRSQQQVSSGMTFDAQAKGGDLNVKEDKTSFLVQQFRMNLGGGSVSANIQDISKDFTSFGQVKESGYGDGDISKFSRERGLKRQGLGFDKVKLGGLSFSGNQSSVLDGSKGISNSEYSLGIGAFKFSTKSEEIERGFTRFQDTGAGDWQRLQHSQGIQNTSRAAEFTSKMGKLSFSNSGIRNTDNQQQIQQSQYRFEGAKLAFDYSTQEVDRKFNRFEVDRGRFGLEAGLRRQNFNLTKATIGKDTNLAFNRSSVRDGDKAFESRDAKISGKTWSLTSSTRDVAQNFARLGSLQAPEQDANINSIAKMYGPGVAGNPNDRAAFLQSAGVKRQQVAGETKIGKDGSLKVSNLNITGKTEGGSLNTVQVQTKNLSINLKQSNLGAQFNELTRLMQFEQRQLGTVVGLKRTDLNASLNMGKKGILNTEFMTSAHGTGSMDRAKLGFRGTGLEVDYNQRNVGQNFGVAGQLEDGERQYLSTLQGFNQKDTRVKYSALKNIQFEYAQSSAFRKFDEESRSNEWMNFNWAIDRATQVAYTKQSTDTRQPLNVLFANSVERLMVNRTFGKTALQVTNEKQDFNGINAQNADSKRTTVAVEHPLTKSTSFRTEQTRTDFSDGTQEQISSNTLNTQVLKRLGLSVTDTNIDREGRDRDEVRRDYGFWYDFGKGVRVSYGQARHMNGLNSGSTQTGLAFGQDANRINPNQAVNGVNGANVNGTQIGYASGANNWDDQQGRTQAFSSFNVQTTKPFHVAFIEDAKFSLSSYQASDNSRWLREDFNSSFEGNVGKYKLGFNYKGQVDQQGARAIDRTFRFKTDYTGKAPLSASFMHKQRVLPNETTFDIREYKIDWRAAKGLVISNQIQTNPEGPFNPNIVLGTLPIAQARNIWRIDFTGNKNFLFGGQFDEMRDDALRTIRRTAGANFSLWNASGSPLNFFYGIEQNDSPIGRNSFVRYGLSFDQRPGPNQVFSLSLGNQGWLQNQNAMLVGQNDWIARLNFQVRF
jgi:hypothetical protein